VLKSFRQILAVPDRESNENRNKLRIVKHRLLNFIEGTKAKFHSSTPGTKWTKKKLLTKVCVDALANFRVLPFSNSEPRPAIVQLYAKQVILLFDVGNQISLTSLRFCKIIQ
jgi:hypothetical protein